MAITGRGLTENLKKKKQRGNPKAGPKLGVPGESTSYWDSVVREIVQAKTSVWDKET